MKKKNMMTWFTLLSMLLIASGSHGVFAEELIGETVPINLSTAHPYAASSPGETVGSFEVTRQNATFVLVHFINFSLNNGDRVEIRDGNGILRQVVTNDEPGKADFWTFAIDGDTAFVKLISGSAGAQAYGFDIDQYGYGFIPLRIESICGTDDKVDIECVSGTEQYERAKSVGRMLYQKDTSWYLCTGSLVSHENHFLSNEHCVNSQPIVDTLQVRFNYQYTTCGGNTVASYVTHYGDAFLVSNYDYDCSLMTLLGDPQATFGYLELDARDMILNETVYIPQHPGGVPKKYDYGPVVDTVANGWTVDSDFGYRVDTEGGSSGSPVLSMSDHTVVGLHHFGGCEYPPDFQNQGVLMKHVYPIIEPYLPDTDYDLCYTSDGWTKKFDIVDNFWLVGEGDHPTCGTGPLVGWVYGTKYALNWDIPTPSSCAESIFYFGHVWDLSYHWINTGGGASGTGTMIPCSITFPGTGGTEGEEDGPSMSDTEQSFCLVDNFGFRHTFTFDGYYLVGQTETIPCGTIPLIGAVEGDLFSFHIDVPTGTGGCPEGMIYAGFVSSLSGVWRTTAGATGGFWLSPCTSSDASLKDGGDPFKTR